MMNTSSTSRVHVAAVSLKGFRQDGGGHLAKAKSGGGDGNESKGGTGILSAGRRAEFQVRGSQIPNGLD